MNRPAMLVGLAACAALVIALATPPASAAEVVGWRDRVVVTAPVAGASTSDRAVYRKLEDVVVSFTFNEQPLEEALDFLSTLGGVNIVVDKRKIEPGKTVTLKLADATLLSAIKLVAEQVGVKWIVRDGVVYLSDEEGVKQEPVTVVVDVSDLLAVPPDFDGPTIELQSISGRRGGQGTGEGGLDIFNPGKDEPKKEVEKSREELLQELVEIIKGVVEAGTWDETP